MGAFLRRHRFTLIVAAAWLAVAWLAWPRVGRCLWTYAIAVIVAGISELWRATIGKPGFFQ
jgi:hypothetical protein